MEVKRWWNLWGKLFASTEEIVEPRLVNTKVYSLSSEQMRSHPVAHLTDHLEEIEEQVLLYVKAQFEEAAGQYLTHVSEYLRRYRAHLKDALVDRERSADDVRERRTTLDRLEVEAGALDDEGRTLIGRLNEATKEVPDDGMAGTAA